METEPEVAEPGQESQARIYWEDRVSPGSRHFNNRRLLLDDGSDFFRESLTIFLAKKMAFDYAGIRVVWVEWEDGSRQLIS